MKRSLTILGLLWFALLAAKADAQTLTADATAAFEDDVHASAGLTCVACHQDQATSGEQFQTPPRTAIAPMCATCHSDATYMNRFNPQVRVDQFLEYQTSTHGRQMAAGEARVATCTDCHGAHGVKRVADPRSPVFPLNVTLTCARCHGDAERMKLFGHTAAPPADWAASVHAAALLERGDTSAPTCATCHGSHGAVPPGVSSVANVCAQCHIREAELFRASPKRDIFEAIGQAECLACHNNHKIEQPADAWVGLEEGTVCALCHDETGDSAETIRAIRRDLDLLSATMAEADATITRAEQAGMLLDDGRTALRDAREHQVQSHVLVHGFAAPPFSERATAGIASAQRAQEAGDAALEELQARRRGLAIATLLILAFLVTLGLKIRRLSWNA
jgi:predicted CXXCH cytochrome family protein